MKKYFLVLIMIFVLSLGLLGAGLALACQPIPSLSFENAVKAADLIVIGQQIKEGPSRPTGWPYGGGPSWIDFKIEEVLKGEIIQNTIRLSTNEVCGCGLWSTSGPGKFMYFLDYSEESKAYKVVSDFSHKGGQWGDGVSGDGPHRPFEIKNNSFDYEDKEGEKWVVKNTTIDDFVKKYNLKREQINYCQKDSDCYPNGHNPKDSVCGGPFYKCRENKCVEGSIEKVDPPTCCLKNSDCGKDVCVDNKCVKQSFWQKIISWFQRVFKK